jgi:phospholipid/cholesterol/gamma-HCH transport system substrate-binding protein
MTSLRLNLAVVGALVLAAVASLVIAVAVLAGRTGATDSYSMLFANVSGLKFGTQVVYEGYPVGHVEKVVPAPQQTGQMLFRVTVEVTRGWKIPRDSVARPTSPGPLAPQIIAISAGSSAESLKPGEQIQTAKGMDIFSSLSSVGGDVDRLTDQALMPLLKNLDHQVTDIGALFNNDVRRLVGNANNITGPLAEQMPALLADARQITGNLAEVSKQLRTLTDDKRLAELDRILANLDTASRHLEKTSETLEALSTGSGRDLQVSLENLRRSTDVLAQHAETIVQNLDSTSRNMNEFSRQIRRDPSLVLRGTPPSDNVQESRPSEEKK